MGASSPKLSAVSTNPSFVTHHSNLTGIMKLRVMIKVRSPSTASATLTVRVRLRVRVRVSVGVRPRAQVRAGAWGKMRSLRATFFHRAI